MFKFATTLSSKNQITLPVAVLQKLGWNSGQKFNIIIKNNTLVIQSYTEILNDIAGIVAGYTMPKVSVEDAIAKTRTNSNSSKFRYEN